MLLPCHRASRSQARDPTVLAPSRGSANGWMAAGAADISAETGATGEGVPESGLFVAGKARLGGAGRAFGE